VTPAACISAQAAGKTYMSARGPVVALRGIELDVADGEFIALLGPSGCGKSTLLRCIAGLEHLSEGTLQVRGKAVTGPPDGIGMVFQRDALLDWRTVLGNVLMAAELRGERPGPFKARAMALLERFGLGSFADRHPWELSGGMRQRASICRALLTEPPILLMDEPFGALDAMTRDDLNVELMRLWQSSRRTVVFVTHSIAEAVFLSDRVAVLSRSPGQIEEVMTIDLPRPRPLTVRDTAAFAEHVAHLRGVFARLGLAAV
jgi:NitT/TauT family transport system ATP-binding protein